MEKIVINPYNLSEEKLVKQEEARALLFNGNNNLLVINYANLYLLPGGKLEKGETSQEGLIRELKEEVGVNNIDLEPFMTLKHYQKDFSSREGNIIDRLVTTDYYTGYLDIDLNNLNNNLSENERKYNFKLEYINIDTLENILLNFKSNNPRQPFFNLELLTVLYQINKKEYIKIRTIKKNSF